MCYVDDLIVLSRKGKLIISLSAPVVYYEKEMELTDDNLIRLSEYLKHTLSPDVAVRRPGNIQQLCYIFCFLNQLIVTKRAKYTLFFFLDELEKTVESRYYVCGITLCLFTAEKFLESVELNQNYPLLLLHLVDKSEIDITIRIAGAVAFKNYVKRNWKVVSATG